MKPRKVQATIAQLAEQRTHNSLVAGSSPASRNHNFIARRKPMNSKLFAEIMIGEDFTWDEKLYCKTSFETAMPISFKGEEKSFKWNDVVYQ